MWKTGGLGYTHSLTNFSHGRASAKPPTSNDDADGMSRHRLAPYTGWPKKSKPPSIFQKIALKISDEIRFLRKVKV